jgi:hypothetical protein
VQQRLRRDATAIQAHAAEPLVAFDEDHLLASVGGIERGSITTRPRAQHHNVCLDRVH